MFYMQFLCKLRFVSSYHKNDLRTKPGYSPSKAGYGPKLQKGRKEKRKKKEGISKVRKKEKSKKEKIKRKRRKKEKQRRKLERKRKKERKFPYKPPIEIS